MSRPRNPPVLATVIDRPSRDGDHLFVGEHHGHRVVGALGADWQRHPTRRARAGLPDDWEEDDAAAEGSGPRLKASIEAPRESVNLGEVEFFDVAGRPMFVVPDEVRLEVGDGHGEDDLVESVRSWYQAAWTVVAMTQFIGQVVDVRAAMLRAGKEKTADFQDIEVELSQARLTITKARAVLVSARKYGVTPVTDEAD